MTSASARPPQSVTANGRRAQCPRDPEVDAISWISEDTLLDNPLNTIRFLVTMALGHNVVGRANSSDLWYAEIRDKAKRFGPR
jgi:hypothetical protein